MTTAQGKDTKPEASAKENPKPESKVVNHPNYEFARLAKRAAPKRRHWAVLGSFIACVIAPAVAATLYVYGVAADQYASRVAFSVRGQDHSAPIEFLGALTAGIGGGGSSADAEIVYEFVRSQQMVEAALDRLPLFEIFNRPEDDVLFRLGNDRAIEDIVSYWRYMTDVSFDAGSGIVHFEARTFDADSARAIAAFVLEESTRVVNDLSVQARDDAVKVAREVVREAEERLRAVRRELRKFRDVEQELDPTENARAALGLVTALEAELARLQVERDTQIALVGQSSPRIAILNQTIESLNDRIEQERSRIGAGGAARSAGGRAFSDLVAEYEELVVDREFAEKAYVSALASYETAQVEARRQMRYLVPHIRPTLSMKPQYPQRALLSAGTFGVLLTGWAVLLLIVYNVRDRR